MQASVALASNREWLDRIWYLKPTYFDGLSAAREMYSAFVAALSMKLHVHAYVAQVRLLLVASDRFWLLLIASDCF